MSQVTQDNLELVVFGFGKEEFGVSTLYVHEIIRITEITSVPNVPEFISGVINLRGEIIPVVNLKECFGMDSFEVEADSMRIVVVEANQLVVGFVVDSVSEVIKISQDVVEPPPGVLSAIDTDYITGVAKLENRLLALLDIEALLNYLENQK